MRDTQIQNRHRTLNINLQTVLLMEGRVVNGVGAVNGMEKDEELLLAAVDVDFGNHDTQQREDNEDDEDDDVNMFVRAAQRQERVAEERRIKRRKRLREIDEEPSNDVRESTDVNEGTILITKASSNNTNAYNETNQSDQAAEKVNTQNDGNDSDEFDMFSSSISPDQVTNRTLPMNTTTTTNDHPTRQEQNRQQQQQDWDDSEGYYKAIIGETIDLNTSSAIHATTATTTNDVDRDTALPSLIRVRVAGVIGKGVFSTVLKCTVISNSSSIALPVTVAMKCIRHNDSMAKAAMTELQILLKLQGSPGIIPLLLPTSATSSSSSMNVSPLEHRGHVLLVFHFMEYNLRDVLQKFGKGVGLSLQAVRSYFGQLLSALSHLQKHHIIHADIKPDNILVRADFAVVQIADFGSAMDLQSYDTPVTINQPTPYLVSRFYRAPEIILGLSPISHMIDLWSVAVTVAELYLGDVLFRGTSNNDMLYVFQQHLGPFSNRVIRQHLVQCQKFAGNNTQQLSYHFQLLPGTGNSYHFKQRTTDTVTGAPVLKVHSLVVTDATSTTNSSTTVKFPLGTPLGSKLMKAKSAKDTRKMVHQFTDLLYKCMTLDPSRRIALKDALRHDFFVTTTTTTTNGTVTSGNEAGNGVEINR
jgi:serine/threonine-protein kinase PRP4